ncbi:MAG: prepilin-type N-terminal cleavage/methylation domain-containing protein [Verrucomicrobiota bacterium]
MKLNAANPNRRRGALGMTLPEVMVTSVIFGLALAGFMGLHIFSMRYDMTVKMKLLASNDARNTLSKVAADIRTAGRVRIGTGDATNFAEVPFGQRQEGNALEVYPDKEATNKFIRYFCDTDDDILKRYTSDGTEIIMARSVTNQLVFTSEDSFGQVLSNNFNNRVIGLNLQFVRNQGSGNGFIYDYYQVRTKVTRRALE